MGLFPHQFRKGGGKTAWKPVLVLYYKGGLVLVTVFQAHGVCKGRGLTPPPPQLPNATKSCPINLLFDDMSKDADGGMVGGRDHVLGDTWDVPMVYMTYVHCPHPTPIWTARFVQARR